MATKASSKKKTTVKAAAPKKAAKSKAAARPELRQVHLQRHPVEGDRQGLAAGRFDRGRLDRRAGGAAASRSTSARRGGRSTARRTPDHASAGRPPTASFATTW